MPESWIGRTVIVEVKGRRGGSYLILGRLHDVMDEGLMIDKQPPEGCRSYPWESVVDVRLPNHA